MFKPSGKRQDHEPGNADAGKGLPGRVRALASQLAGRALTDPRVQDVTGSLRGRGEELRGQVRDRAEQRLENLIEQRRQERGGPLPPEVGAALASRRHEREQRAAQQHRRAQALQHAAGPEERRVLTRVADASPRTGGQPPAPRYTALLDALAPGGNAEREMAVHRAIWSLAERRVLAVSVHGEVEFGPLVTEGPEQGGAEELAEVGNPEKNEGKAAP